MVTHHTDTTLIHLEANSHISLNYWSRMIRLSILQVGVAVCAGGHDAWHLMWDEKRTISQQMMMHDTGTTLHKVTLWQAGCIILIWIHRWCDMLTYMWISIWCDMLGYTWISKWCDMLGYTWISKWCDMLSYMWIRHAMFYTLFSRWCDMLGYSHWMHKQIGSAYNAYG